MNTITSPATPATPDTHGKRESAHSVPPKLYTVNEICTFLGLSRSAVYYYMRHGLLKFVMVGCQRRVTAAELERVMIHGIPETAEEHRARKAAERAELDKQESARRSLV